MFNNISRFGASIWNGINTIGNPPKLKNGEYPDAPPLKFKYTRPSFLQRSTDDEVQVSADHTTRPIMVPRDIKVLPWDSGYSEAINAGKSARNEDQATYYSSVLKTEKPAALKKESKPDSPFENAVVINKMESKTGLPEIEVSLVEADQTSEIERDASEKIDFQSKNFLPDVADESVELDGNISEEPSYTTPLSTPESQRKEIYDYTIPWKYFALFDGHGGSGVAVAASNTLHLILEEKLQDVADLINQPKKPSNNGFFPGSKGGHDRMPPNADYLIIGALESAFHEMDRRIAIDKKCYTMTGGCTALVALFMNGKLYVANAGDSRAVICQGLTAIPMSNDFTPETETNRLRKLGQMRPELLGEEFTHLDFYRRPTLKDVGTRVLYRDAYMTGWCYKTISREDLKFPLIHGEGKRSRLLATIGVTRGFGDHDLKALDTGHNYYTDVMIKPFLSSEPEVMVLELEEQLLSDADVLVMGTDGLWDVTSNEKAAECVHTALVKTACTDDKYKYRFNIAALDLVMLSRGKLRDRHWRTSDNKMATIDDISVFVIPLLPYKEEYREWKRRRDDLQKLLESKNSESIVKNV